MEKQNCAFSVIELIDKAILRLLDFLSFKAEVLPNYWMMPIVDADLIITPIKWFAMNNYHENWFCDRLDNSSLLFLSSKMTSVNSQQLIYGVLIGRWIQTTDV